MIERNAPVEIRAVGNGYVVTPAYVHSRVGTTLAPDDDTMVFESQPSMLQWLSKHFDHPEPA
jgi:hypothetical protein